tara:strand:+ start:1217 stop:1423 length:207 start_codon:yes stop_codon:yes gene_type:complete
MKIKKRDLYKGKLVKLNPKNYFDFIDTDPIGVVLDWDGKCVNVVFNNGVKDSVWLWNLLDPYESNKGR